MHILPCVAAQRYRSCDTCPRISPDGVRGVRRGDVTDARRGVGVVRAGVASTGLCALLTSNRRVERLRRKILGRRDENVRIVYAFPIGIETGSWAKDYDGIHRGALLERAVRLLLSNVEAGLVPVSGSVEDKSFGVPRKGILIGRWSSSARVNHRVLLGQRAAVCKAF